MTKDFEIEAKVKNKTREQFSREGDDTFRIEFSNDNGFSGVIKVSKERQSQAYEKLVAKQLSQSNDVKIRLKF